MKRCLPNMFRYAHAFNSAVLPGVALPNTVSNLGRFGAAYQVTPALSVAGSAYYQNLRESNAGNPWQFVALVGYALSKRTDVYSTVSYVLNRGKSNLGVNGFNDQLGASSEAVRPGANQLVRSSAFATSSEPAAMPGAEGIPGPAAEQTAASSP